MPAGTKVAKAEQAIRHSATAKGLKGRKADAYVYGALNNEGLMHGSKATKRGLRKVMSGGHPTPKTIVR